MGWQAAIASTKLTGAVVGALGAAQFQQQGAIGKFNVAVNNRNALIAEQEATQIEKQTEFDIAQFNKSYKKIVGQTEVSFAKSGVVSGQDTAYRIAAENAREKYLQENITKYNSQVAQAQKLEQSNFARIYSQIAKQETRSAQMQTLASTGTSLLQIFKGTE